VTLLSAAAGTHPAARRLALARQNLRRDVVDQPLLVELPEIAWRSALVRGREPTTLVTPRAYLVGDLRMVLVIASS